METVSFSQSIAPTASKAVQSTPAAQIMAKTLSKLPDPAAVRTQAMNAAGKGVNLNVTT